MVTFLGRQGLPEPLRRYDEHGVAARGSVPSYVTPEAGVRALAKATAYAQWRSRPRGRIPALDRLDEVGARSIVDEVLADQGSADRAGGVDLDGETVRELLGCYGVDVWPEYAVGSVDEALAAAAGLGWDVVLKATAPHLRQRPDLADVWRNIAGEAEMREAWATMSATLGGPAVAGFVVQKMAPPGVPVVIGCAEDEMFGPIVSFGLAGVATDLLGDLSYRIPPLTDVDVAGMVREVRAAPLLFGHRGGEQADVAAVEDLLHRMARLAHALPEVHTAELVPVLAGPTGVAVLGARLRLAPVVPQARTDWYARRLTRV